ncbi:MULTISPECIES: hypothetical protein [Pantoea]|uniref:Uncharacterized protein n=1 Tax=Candidatus Pantoea gossypiicola TaxID=2608008 RepID=A0AB34CMG4_9GAMM|nr:MULTISPECIES: hypothetical protein [Pantoea]KAA5931524.1 hypothetical protein F3I59_05470 [Pantoea sp. VH_8]KAA5936659.1 hypothetical protein F3I58_05500 [Pantoea sp. VH_4]KAA5957771.1 hypothetical protein F3I53_16100 [Pantoea sp. VH_16]KAA5987929.1 hypothetical protein F3I49_05390 [Pantoea sp. M_4]KAA6104671.1 hypothetical protein F3I25_16350 [Pantoea sp. Bo_14]
MMINPENVLLDSACPCCERTAVLELKVMPEMYDPQQLMVVVKCHFCETTFNDFVRINEMEACDGL